MTRAASAAPCDPTWAPVEAVRTNEPAVVKEPGDE
jgi:hypothetical protein